MRILATICCVLISSLAFSQAEMRFHGTIGLRMEGGTVATPTYVVIDNPSNLALRDADAPGGAAIWSEDEYNIIKWNVQTNTGTYTVPFISPSAAYVSPSIDVITPGSESVASEGTIEFSTYRHNNALATIPSDVTHMKFDDTGLPGGENDAIDRFWIVDAKNYTAGGKPVVDVTFAYDLAELEGTMNGNNLLIQRFNSTPGVEAWIDYYIPTTSTSAFAPLPNATSNAAIPLNDFYRSWTLSNRDNPLPIELTEFTSECKGTEGVELSWTTSSEVNNSHFSLERSEDGIIWETFADDIHAAGNSSSEQNYSYTDNNPFRGLTYYQLTQTDFDYTSVTFDPIVSDCDGVGFELINAYTSEVNGEVQLVVSAGRDEVFNIEVLDMNGRVAAAQQNVVLLEGLNYFTLDKTNIGYGVYMIKLQSENELMSRKILLN